MAEEDLNPSTHQELVMFPCTRSPEAEQTQRLCFPAWLKRLSGRYAPVPPGALFSHKGHQSLAFHLSAPQILKLSRQPFSCLIWRWTPANPINIPVRIWGVGVYLNTPSLKELCAECQLWNWKIQLVLTWKMMDNFNLFGGNWQEFGFPGIQTIEVDL